MPATSLSFDSDLMDELALLYLIIDYIQYPVETLLAFDILHN